MELSPYVMFNGDCEEAFRFYEKHLGGKDLALMRYGDSPMAKNAPGAADKIMHARLRLGKTPLMGSDALAPSYQKPEGVSVALAVDKEEEAERIFEALAEGGTTQMPIQETFWAKRFGMVTDRFGTPWMVNCERPMQGGQQP